MLDFSLIPPDPASRLTIRRFALTLTLAIVLALFARPGYRMSFFFAMTSLAVTVSAVFALFGQDKFNGPTINRWDETLAYMAVSVLAMAVTTSAD